MKNFSNYIYPVFFTMEKGSEKYKIILRTRTRDDLKIDFSMDEVEETMKSILDWLPYRRRFFCSSNKKMSSFFTGDFIRDVHTRLKNPLHMSIWGEIVSFFDVDIFLANIGLDIDSGIKRIDNFKYNIDRIEEYYNLIIDGKHDNEILNANMEVANFINNYKDSLTWVDLVDTGSDSAADIFEACGNHMIGDSFKKHLKKDKIMKEEQRLAIFVNRITAIAEIQELSMLNTCKVFIDICKEKGGVYKINMLMDGISKETYICDDMFDIVSSQRRAFIGFGDKNLEYIREILKDKKIPEHIKVIFEEISLTYIDIQKPFSKLFLKNDIDSILEYSEISKSENMCSNIESIDIMISENIDEAIERFSKAAINQCEKRPEFLESLIKSAFMQSFKYFYSVTPEIC